jgi:hypothetical protein
MKKKKQMRNLRSGLRNVLDGEDSIAGSGHLRQARRHQQRLQGVLGSILFNQFSLILNKNRISRKKFVCNYDLLMDL